MPFVLQDVGRFALGFVIGTNQKFTHQAKQDKLDADQETENRKQQYRVSVGFDAFKELLVERQSAQCGAGHEGQESQHRRRDTWVWLNNFRGT